VGETYASIEPNPTFPESHLCVSHEGIGVVELSSDSAKCEQLIRYVLLGRRLEANPPRQEEARTFNHIIFSIDLVCNNCLHRQFKRTRNCPWQVEQYVLNTTTYGTYAHSHEVYLVAGEGFEPSKAEPGDLQSPPIGRSGNPPGSYKCCGALVVASLQRYLRRLNFENHERGPQWLTAVSM
jgi:hypothetical protein